MIEGKGTQDFSYIVKKLFCSVFFNFLICTTAFANANTMLTLNKLKKAYPDHIKAINAYFVQWHDGSRIPVEGNPILGPLMSRYYHLDNRLGLISKRDIQREHYEAFFKKMYGDSHLAVKENLVTIYWMPKIFGKRYPLKVTTINEVHKRLQHISEALEQLPKHFHKYLAQPAGSFCWRNVLGESYLSTHSFGIAIDINPKYANYWLWDAQKNHLPISQLIPQNKIPTEIVQVFEKEGFYWGGHWYYYDTMHFEYRPDLLLTKK